MPRFVKMLPVLFVLGFTFATVKADDQPPVAGPAGIIILKAVAGYPAGAVSFVSIEWLNNAGGDVVDAAGAKTLFVNDGVGRIIYFDQGFYDEVDHNQNWIDWRAGIQNHEIVLQPAGSIGLTAGDLPRLRADQGILEDTIGRYPSGTELVAPLIAQLKDDIDKLSRGLVLHNGNWMTQQQAEVAAAVPVVGEEDKRATFTTKDGKTYVNAKIKMTDSGLSVITSDGGACVPFEELPNDLSAFPDKTRGQIRDALAKIHAAEAPPKPVVVAPPPPETFFGKIAALFHQAVAGVQSYFDSKPAATPVSATPSAPSSAASPADPADIVKSVVMVKGDVGEGTGFLTKTPDGPVVITNLHVVAANPNLKIFTASGQQVVVLGMKGASDRDIAMFSIQDNNYSYLTLASSVDGTTSVGDAAVIPGNSEGGEVTLKTNGSVVGIGPQRVEFSNPIYHGNSGSPVIDLKNGLVIAVATGATEMNPLDDVDKNSYANANSAIKGPMRYFGMRLDTVPNWETYDQGQFVHEGLFLKAFHQESLALDSYLNGDKYARNLTREDGPPIAKYYMTNAKVRAADENYQRMIAGENRDSASQQLAWDLDSMADADISAVENPLTFYSYDQRRVKYELEYRKALKAEIDAAKDRIHEAGSNGLNLSL